MSDSRPLQINMSAISVAGVGGLGMVAMVGIMAAAFQPARWLLAAGIAGGATIAIALIAKRRHRRIGGPRGDLPLVLFRRPNNVTDGESAEGRAAN